MAKAKRVEEKKPVDKYKVYIALIVFGRIFAGAV